MSKLIKFYTLNIMHITQSSYLKIMGWINSSVSFLVQLDYTSHLSGATNVSANGDEVHLWSQTCCVCYLMPVFLYYYYYFWLFYITQLAGSQVPQPGIEPGPWQWKPGILPTSYQGIPQYIHFYTCLFLPFLRARGTSHLKVKASTYVLHPPHTFFLASKITSVLWFPFPLNLPL